MDKFWSVITFVVEFVKSKIEGDHYMPDWRTIAKMVWPWLLGIVTNTIGPKFNIPADVIAGAVTILNYVFAVLVIGTVANVTNQLNKAGMMKGLGFKK